MKTTFPMPWHTMRCALLCLSLALATSLLSQDNLVDSLDQQAIELQEAKEKVSALQSILESIPNLEEEATLLKAQLENDTLTDIEKERITLDLESVDLKLQNLNKDLAVIASGIDPSSFFDKAPDPEVDFDKEFRDMLYPVVDKIKRVTNRPREIERLRLELSDNKERLEQISDALIKLDQLIVHAEHPLVRNQLQLSRQYWEEQKNAFETKTEAVRLHLREMLSQEKSISQILKENLVPIYKSHGKHLLLALLGMLATFLVFFFLQRLYNVLIERQKPRKYKFLVRLGELFFYLFTFIASVGVFILILVAFSDWLLLGIFFFLFIIGLWSARNALPRILQEIKLLLNLGSVREDERVIYNNIPWRVESINLYSVFVNKELGNSKIRLPLKDLIDLRSRKYSPSEPWFPSRVGEWVSLDDGFTGKVLKQNADSILLEVNRGVRKSYPVANYLNNNPQNLSRSSFTVSEIIGIDYKYRQVVNDVLSPQLESQMRKYLKESIYGPYVQEVLVELEKMNSSSIDLEFFVKFDGVVAYDYFEIPGRVQQMAMDCLNLYGIDIPFPHLTIQTLKNKDKN